MSIYYAPPERAAVEAMAEAGIDRALFGLPSAGADVVLPLLDDFTAAAKGL